MACRSRLQQATAEDEVTVGLAVGEHIAVVAGEWGDACSAALAVEEIAHMEDMGYIGAGEELQDCGIAEAYVVAGSSSRCMGAYTDCCTCAAEEDTVGLYCIVASFRGLAAALPADDGYSSCRPGKRSSHDGC